MTKQINTTSASILASLLLSHTGIVQKIAQKQIPENKNKQAEVYKVSNTNSVINKTPASEYY